MAFQPNDDADCLSMFRQHMDEMFNYMFRLKEQGSVQHEFSPYMDICESASQYVIEVDLPGFSENDFTITTIGSTIRLEGVKRQERIDSAMSYICLERHFGRFSRSIEIPSNFDPEKISMSCERGVLSIKIARRNQESGVSIQMSA